MKRPRKRGPFHTAVGELPADKDAGGSTLVVVLLIIVVIIVMVFIVVFAVTATGT